MQLSARPQHVVGLAMTECLSRWSVGMGKLVKVRSRVSCRVDEDFSMKNEQQETGSALYTGNTGGRNQIQAGFDW